MARCGVLVVNVGSPEAPEASAVRRYLRQFLSDPRVIDIHPVGRWLLLNLIILPFRPRQSAEAYAKIWTDDGSPLLIHSRALVEGLDQRLESCQVELGMRYGSPSIAQGIASLRGAGCDRLVVFPVYASPLGSREIPGTGNAEELQLASGFVSTGPALQLASAVPHAGWSNFQRNIGTLPPRLLGADRPHCLHRASGA